MQLTKMSSIFNLIIETHYNGAMRWVYLSPHLDDAALSAGGLLYDKNLAGEQVEILTIVCGYPPQGELTPLAQLLHAQWKTGTAEETIRLRRDEDAHAAGLLGVKSHYLDLPDCIYRRGPDGEALYQNIFVEPHPFESDLPSHLAQKINGHLQPEDRVICQLALGGHVDHILVRRAAEQLLHPLWYVADLPYHFKQPGELERQVAGMNLVLHPVSDPGFQAWIRAILAYSSQLSSLFEETDEIEPQVRGYCVRWGGFPVWKPV